MAVCPSRRWRSGLVRPVSRSATRRPTSRRSAARSRKYASSTPARRSACSDPIDCLDRGGAVCNGGQRRLEDPGIPREQCLGLEDRTDLLARPTGRFASQRVELSRRGGHRGSQPVGLDREIERPRATLRGLRRTDRLHPQKASDGRAGRSGSTNEKASGHRSGGQPTTSARVARSNADDVAPGSWWPMLRSPR